MLHRARRCPYGALLDAHCPMPAGAARRLGGNVEEKIRNEKAGADGFRVDADVSDDGGDVSGEDRLSNDADADALDFGESSVTERVTGVTGDSQFGGNATAGNGVF